MTKLKVTNRFGIVPNDLLNNPEISLKAKGLFAYLQSKPENWVFSTSRICSQMKEGRDSIRNILQELEDFGYLLRAAKKTAEGKWNGFDYYLYSEPTSMEPEAEKTADGKAVDGKAVLRENRMTENQEALSKKDFSKKDFSKKEEVTAHAAPASIVLEEIILAFNKTSFPKVTTLTDKRKKLLSKLIDKHGKQKVLIMISKAKASDFLNNRTKSQRNWKANFDWLINENNFIKVIEGAYDNSYKNEPTYRKNPIDL